MKQSTSRCLYRLAAFAICCALTQIALAAPEGRFSIVQDDNGTFWFSDQDGPDKFLSIGINHVVEAHDHEPPEGSIYYDPIPTVFGGDHDAWRHSTNRILSEHGFNTFGSWSSPKVNNGDLYETPILYVAGYADERVLAGFDEDFEKTVRENLYQMIDPIENPDDILGVFLDNEMAWYGKSPWDDNPRYTVLEHALTLEDGNRARGHVLKFLKEKYVSPKVFAEAWGIDETPWEELTGELLRASGTEAAMADRDEFLTKAADLFFSKATAVVREEMPGVLILGTRFAGNAPDPVIKACGKYCDVVSYNHYRAPDDIDARLAARYWLLGGKPMMITEYSWRGHINRSGNPNSGGAGSVVLTQAERGESYAGYTADAAAWPMIIGLHWFEFSDQSPHGRFDGENSNYGVVNLFHEPYADLLKRMKVANARLQSIHAESQRTLPDQLPEQPKAVFSPNQYPNRPAAINILDVPPARDIEVFEADDASLEITPADQGITLSLDTGSTWGCGISIAGPADWEIPDAPMGATNLDGYTKIVIKLESQDNTPMQVILDEAGVDSPNAPGYDTRAGDDGESFAFETVDLEKGSNTIDLSLYNMTTRGVWGNQRGQKEIDIDAIKGIGLVFLPGPSPTTISIQSITLKK